MASDALYNVQYSVISLVAKASGSNSVQAEDWSGFETQLWSRTWDNCLENKATGKVKQWITYPLRLSEFQVLASDGEDLWLEEVDAAGCK